MAHAERGEWGWVSFVNLVTKKMNGLCLVAENGEERKSNGALRCTTS